MLAKCEEARPVVFWISARNPVSFAATCAKPTRKYFVNHDTVTYPEQTQCTWWTNAEGCEGASN